MPHCYSGIKSVILLITIATYATGYNSLDKDVILVERIKRSIKGYARGQTQTQYLNFGKPEVEGKAEAAANESGSRSTVLGTHGMGQAQSQFSSGDCGECPGVSMYDYSLGPPDPLKVRGSGYQPAPLTDGKVWSQRTITNGLPAAGRAGLDIDSRKTIPSAQQTYTTIPGTGFQQPLSGGAIPGMGLYAGAIPSQSGDEIKTPSALPALVPGYRPTTSEGKDREQYSPGRAPQVIQGDGMGYPIHPSGVYAPVAYDGRSTLGQRTQEPPSGRIAPSITQPTQGILQQQAAPPHTLSYSYDGVPDQRTQAIGRPSMQPTSGMTRPLAQTQIGSQVLPQTYGVGQPGLPITQPKIPTQSQGLFGQPLLPSGAGIRKPSESGGTIMQPSVPQPTTVGQQKPVYYTAPPSTGPQYEGDSRTWATPQRVDAGYPYGPSYGLPGAPSTAIHANTTATTTHKNGKAPIYSGVSQEAQQHTRDQQNLETPSRGVPAFYTSDSVSRGASPTGSAIQTQGLPQSQISVPLSGPPQTTISFGAQQGFGLQIGIGGTPSRDTQGAVGSVLPSSTLQGGGIPIVQQPGLEVRIHPTLTHGVIPQPEGPQRPDLQYHVKPSEPGTQQFVQIQPGTTMPQMSGPQYEGKPGQLGIQGGMQTSQYGDRLGQPRPQEVLQKPGFPSSADQQRIPQGMVQYTVKPGTAQESRTQIVDGRPQGPLLQYDIGQGQQRTVSVQPEIHTVPKPTSQSQTPQEIGMRPGMGVLQTPMVQYGIPSTQPQETSYQPATSVVQRPGLQYVVGPSQPDTLQQSPLQIGTGGPQGPGIQYGAAPSQRQDVLVQSGTGMQQRPGVQYISGSRQPDILQQSGVQRGVSMPQGPGLQYGLTPTQPQEIQVQPGTGVEQKPELQYIIRPSQPGAFQDSIQSGVTRPQETQFQYGKPQQVAARPGAGVQHTSDMQYITQPSQPGFSQRVDTQPQIPAAYSYETRPDQMQGIPTQPGFIIRQSPVQQYALQPGTTQQSRAQEGVGRPGASTLQYGFSPSFPTQKEIQGTGTQYGVISDKPGIQSGFQGSQPSTMQAGFYERPDTTRQTGTIIGVPQQQATDRYGTILRPGISEGAYGQVMPTYGQQPGQSGLQPTLSRPSELLSPGTTGVIQTQPGVAITSYDQSRDMQRQGLSAPSVGMGTDDAFSQAETSISNGQASASAEGKKRGGAAKTQVQGTYSSTGSFTASAMTSDNDRSASSQVSGNSEGAMSQAQGQGGAAQSQAQVQVNEKTGGTKASSQSGGIIHQSQSEVQANDKGGLADAQSSGPGQTSSQAQIGFRPGQDGNIVQSVGGGQASAQSGSHSGQSQSQIQGTSKFGVSYHGAAQSASGTKEQVASYREQNRNLFNAISQFGGADAITDRVDTIFNPTGLTSAETGRIPDLQMKSSKSHNQATNKLDNEDSNLPYDEDDEEPLDEYDDDDYYNDSLIKINSKSMISNVSAKPNENYKTKLSGELQKKDIRLHNSNDSNDNDVPNGFRGTINVEKKFHTKSLEVRNDANTTKSNDSPINESSSISKKTLSPDSYVTVTKSITGSMNNPKNPSQDNKNFQSTFYTKSSTCGYFTFSCNIVYGANGRSKICRPKAPANGKC